MIAPKMVVLIDRNTHKICLGLSKLCGASVQPWKENECGNLELDAYLIVQRVGCYVPPSMLNEPCNCAPITPGISIPYSHALPAPSTVSMPPGPAIRYDAFDSDPDGLTCFYLDDKLLAAAQGRYDVQLFVAGVAKSAFQIELRDRIRVTSITKVRGRACHE